MLLFSEHRFRSLVHAASAKSYSHQLTVFCVSTLLFTFRLRRLKWMLYILL